ncbi:MAG: cytochrome c, partial [Candidatus Nitrotoga sp.]|nr:cytochrome c [Candidatus Nitrotoga sp.]
MKTSIWLATMAVAVIATLAWFTKQPEIAQAEIATQPSVAQVQMVSQQNSAYTDSGFHSGEVGLNPSARAGREIWFKATAGNERFHTYTFQQRVGVLIDWFRVLRGDQREQRFQTWGLINDPGCCTPGSPNCPAKSREETYGFDWCPGDETLLKFVGKSGYRDPACDFKDAPAESTDPKGHQDGRED